MSGVKTDFKTAISSTSNRGGNKSLGELKFIGKPTDLQLKLAKNFKSSKPTTQVVSENLNNIMIIRPKATGILNLTSYLKVASDKQPAPIQQGPIQDQAVNQNNIPNNNNAGQAIVNFNEVNNKIGDIEKEINNAVEGWTEDKNFIKDIAGQAKAQKATKSGFTTLKALEDTLKKQFPDGTLPKDIGEAIKAARLKLIEHTVVLTLPHLAKPLPDATKLSDLAASIDSLHAKVGGDIGKLVRVLANQGSIREMTTPPFSQIGQSRENAIVGMAGMADIYRDAVTWPSDGSKLVALYGQDH